MRGFSFNGLHSSYFGVVVKKKSRPILPQTNDRYLQFPGRQGAFLFSGEFSDRIIEIECWTISDNLENLQLKMRDIAKWLFTTDRQYLIFDDENDKYYIAKTEDIIEKEQTNTYAEFKVRFRCEPLAYGGYIETDFVNDTVTVYNQGTFEALPLFEITFIESASEFRVQLGNQYIRILKNFAVNDYLEINTTDGAVKLNGQRILESLDWQNSIFFVLPIGESVLNITPIGKCNARIVYRQRWL